MDTEKKRAMEADVMSEMIAIYCRGQGLLRLTLRLRSALTAAVSSTTHATVSSAARAWM